MALDETQIAEAIALAMHSLEEARAHLNKIVPFLAIPPISPVGSTPVDTTKPK